jgi:hypothetical protein
MYLLGQLHKASAVYDDVLSLSSGISKEISGFTPDWKILHRKGLVHLALKEYSAAAKRSKRANSHVSLEESLTCLG